jgi:hypothetical protein
MSRDPGEGAESEIFQENQLFLADLPANLSYQLFFYAYGCAWMKKVQNT